MLMFPLIPFFLFIKTSLNPDSLQNAGLLFPVFGALVEGGILTRNDEADRKLSDDDDANGNLTMRGRL